MKYYRERVLTTLLDMCRQLEHMQAAPASRQACEEVAAILRAALAEERRRG